MLLLAIIVRYDSRWFPLALAIRKDHTVKNSADHLHVLHAILGNAVVIAR